MTYRRVPNNHKTHSSLSLFEQQHVSTSNNLGHCWVSQRNIVYYQLPYGSGRSVYLHELCSESSLHTNCGLSTIGFIVSIILERSHLNNLNLYQIQSCFSFESNQIACELKHCYINRKKEQSYQNASGRIIAFYIAKPLIGYGPNWFLGIKELVLLLVQTQVCGQRRYHNWLA